MNAKKLIEANNVKREQLTQENEAYYSDMLLYIRLQFRLSEQQSEEVLMEMLDHLLEGQANGKTARDIFGEDPKAYAEEIVQQLPNELKRRTFEFVAELVVNLIGWMLVTRGVVLFGVSWFHAVDSTVFLVSSLVSLIVLVGAIGSVVEYIFKLIKDSLFRGNSGGDRIFMIKAGVAGALSMGLVMATTSFLPDLGPSFVFPWWASVVLGLILVGAGIAKKRLG